MSPFDPYFGLLRAYVDSLRDRGRSVRVWPADESPGPGIPPDQAASRLVLRENTAVELGGPLSTSSRFMLWTDEPSLLHDRSIVLVGPDIDEIDAGTHPFGQVTLVAGTSLGEHMRLEIEQAQGDAERVPGYMVRSTGGKIWSRVSHEALARGLSLRSLGAAIVGRLHASLSAVAAVEVLFVTSSVEDIESLERMGVQVRKISHDLRRERLRQATDGAYECQSLVSCEACSDREVCTEIRQVLAIRKKGA